MYCSEMRGVDNFMVSVVVDDDDDDATHYTHSL
jgi:hypothetical protein